MSETILITGGLGYIGGRITKYLLENTDYSVRITTRQSSPTIPAWLYSDQIVQADFSTENDLGNLCRDIKCIIHLAAANETVCQADPELALRVNGLGTQRLLLAAETANVARFIYLSTAHIYGSPLHGTITEKTIPRPIHPYAITHKTAEDIVLSANDQNIITGIVLRLSNGFGVPTGMEIDRWTLLVNDLCRQAVTQKKLKLRSSGIQKRDFITLADVCRAVLHFIKLPIDKCYDGLFNLGGDYSQRILDMANLVAERCENILGFRPEVIHPDPTTNELSLNLEYIIEKLESTGFTLQKNIHAEIDATLKLCQKEFD